MNLDHVVRSSFDETFKDLLEADNPEDLSKVATPGDAAITKAILDDMTMRKKIYAFLGFAGLGQKAAFQEYIKSDPVNFLQTLLDPHSTGVSLATEKTLLIPLALVQFGVAIGKKLEFQAEATTKTKVTSGAWQAPGPDQSAAQD